MPGEVEQELLVSLTFEHVKQWRMEVWCWFMGRHEVFLDIYNNVLSTTCLVSDSREMNSQAFLPRTSVHVPEPPSPTRTYGYRLIRGVEKIMPIGGCGGNLTWDISDE